MANQYTVNRKWLIQVLIVPITIVLVVSIICGAVVDVVQANRDRAIKTAEIEARNK